MHHLKKKKKTAVRDSVVFATFASSVGTFTCGGHLAHPGMLVYIRPSATGGALQDLLERWGTGGIPSKAEKVADTSCATEAIGGGNGAVYVT